MAWSLSIRKETFKFLLKQDADTQNRLKSAMNTLLDYLDKGIFPITEMDIRRLKGDKKDFMRMRVGAMRIIFKIDTSTRTVIVYAIANRGDVYKR